jgi:hypothetical protein
MPSASGGPDGAHVLEVAAPADDRRFSGLGIERRNDPTGGHHLIPSVGSKSNEGPVKNWFGGAILSDVRWPETPLWLGRHMNYRSK